MSQKLFEMPNGVHLNGESKIFGNLDLGGYTTVNTELPAYDDTIVSLAYIDAALERLAAGVLQATPQGAIRLFDMGILSEGDSQILGDLDMRGHAITGIGYPQAFSDIATKEYVQHVVDLWAVPQPPMAEYFNRTWESGFLSDDHSTIDGDLDMAGYEILNATWMVNGVEFTPETKEYVQLVWDGTNFIEKEGEQLQQIRNLMPLEAGFLSDDASAIVGDLDMTGHDVLNATITVGGESFDLGDKTYIQAQADAIVLPTPELRDIEVTGMQLWESGFETDADSQVNADLDMAGYDVLNYSAIQVDGETIDMGGKDYVAAGISTIEFLPAPPEFTRIQTKVYWDTGFSSDDYSSILADLDMAGYDILNAVIRFEGKTLDADKNYVESATNAAIALIPNPPLPTDDLLINEFDTGFLADADSTIDGDLDMAGYDLLNVNITYGVLRKPVDIAYKDTYIIPQIQSAVDALPNPVLSTDDKLLNEFDSGFFADADSSITGNLDMAGYDILNPVIMLNGELYDHATKTYIASELDITELYTPLLREIVNTGTLYYGAGFDTDADSQINADLDMAGYDILNATIMLDGKELDATKLYMLAQTQAAVEALPNPPLASDDKIINELVTGFYADADSTINGDLDMAGYDVLNPILGVNGEAFEYATKTYMTEELALVSIPNPVLWTDTAINNQFDSGFYSDADITINGDLDMTGYDILNVAINVEGVPYDYAVKSYVQGAIDTVLPTVPNPPLDSDGKIINELDTGFYADAQSTINGDLDLAGYDLENAWITVAWQLVDVAYKDWVTTKVGLIPALPTSEDIGIDNMLVAGFDSDASITINGDLDMSGYTITNINLTTTIYSDLSTKDYFNQQFNNRLKPVLDNLANYIITS